MTVIMNRGTKYLAFDFGAQSGRAILGRLSGRTLDLEEIHRFPNRPILLSGHLHWDFDYLFSELKKGLVAAAERGHSDLLGIGVDTWGVDFGLIGKDGRLLGPPFAYRDSRTDGMMERAFECVQREEIYAATGTQFMQVNTIYQLLSMVESESPLLDRAETLLFMPDLFGFFLSGERYSEYTIASTSQLLNAKSRIWEPRIFEKLGLPMNIMAPLKETGTVVGRLRTEAAGLSSADVIAPAGHDTACAVVAVPAVESNWAYLSSGTWSLLGVELDEPIIGEDSLAHNFTNEGGAGGKIRFLRNTMGLWLLERCMDVWKREEKGPTYEELTSRAVESTPFQCVVDSDDPLFLNPRDMTAAIAEFCRRSRQAAPATPGEYVRSILESLALKYRFIIEKLSAIRGVSIDVLHVVGGGSKNELLNQWTANATGLPVVAGPTEATAIGNILVQAIAKSELAGIEEARRFVARSFPLRRYEPEDQDAWRLAYEEKKDLFS